MLACQPLHSHLKLLQIITEEGGQQRQLELVANLAVSCVSSHMATTAEAGGTQLAVGTPLNNLRCVLCQACLALAFDLRHWHHTQACMRTMPTMRDLSASRRASVSELCSFVGATEVESIALLGKFNWNVAVRAWDGFFSNRVDVALHATARGTNP